LSARRKFYPESSLDFLLVAAPRSANAAAGIAGNERIWNPPAVSGAEPNIVRTADVCQRVKGAIPGKNRCGLRSSALPI